MSRRAGFLFKWTAGGPQAEPPLVVVSSALSVGLGEYSPGKAGQSLKRGGQELLTQVLPVRLTLDAPKRPLSCYYRRAGVRPQFWL